MKLSRISPRAAWTVLAMVAAHGLCAAQGAQDAAKVQERVRAVLAGVDELSQEAPEDASRVLARMGTEAVPVLFDFLVEGHVGLEEPVKITPGRRALALEALDRLPRSAVRAHVTAKGAPPAPRRAGAAALEVLGRIGRANDLEVMIGLAVPSPGGPVERPLANALERAVEALLARDGQALRRLAANVRHTDERLWFWLLPAMARSERPGALTILHSLLGLRADQDHLVLSAMGQAAHATPRPLDPRLVRTVAAYADSGEASLRRAATTCLGRLETHEAVPALLGLIDDEDRGVAEAARWALRGLAGLELGNDPERWRNWYGLQIEWWESVGAARCAAILEADPSEVFELLGELSGRRLFRHVAVDPLLALLERREPAIRAAACSALGGIVTPEAIAGLELALDDPTDSVHVAAREALRRAKPNNPLARGQTRGENQR